MHILSKIKKDYLGIISVFSFFLLWEYVARINIVDPLFISSPFKIMSAGLNLISSGDIYPHLMVSLEALFLGLFLAVLFGVFAGILIGSSELLHNFFSPYVYALSSLPTVAIIPLVIIWFGIGIYAKIIIVFLMALKPILINIIDGVKNIDSRLLIMAKSFGANNFFVLKTITVFGILPFVFAGLRISIGRCITGLIVGEAYGYGKGLGFLVSFYGMSFQTSRLMFVIIILLLISMILIGLIKMAEKKIIKWKRA